MRSSTTRARTMRFIAVPVAAVALALGGAACGDDEQDTTVDEELQEEGEELEQDAEEGGATLEEEGEELETEMESEMETESS